MKKGFKKGSKTMVMLALAAVLLVSLGYLSMQGGGREGMEVAKPMKEKFGCKKETMKPHGENFAGRAGKEAFGEAIPPPPKGKCSKSVYNNQTNCEANKGTWTLD